MKKIGIVRIMALLMSLHFGSVYIYTCHSDSIVIETDADSDSEKEDSKKEHKLVSFLENFAEDETMEEKNYSFFGHPKWNVPNIEISNPPPDEY